MKLEYFFEFGMNLLFGVWLLVFPQSVIRFYGWFHKGRVRMPEAFGIRLSGALWIALVSAVFITFLIRN